MGNEIMSNLIYDSKKSVTFSNLPKNVPSDEIKSVISDDVQDDDSMTLDELSGLNGN